jgi:hypothetical protein
MDSTIKSFLIDHLQLTNIPDYPILISQLGLSTGGLGLLCPRTCAAPNFVLSMISAFQNATQGFRLHQDLHPHMLHITLQDLFHISQIPHSLILNSSPT